MRHFLLIYDRALGVLVRMERHDTSGEAIRARFRAESEFRGRGSIEVVAVDAATEDELRRTHARYFLGIDALAARMS